MVIRITVHFYFFHLILTATSHFQAHANYCITFLHFACLLNNIRISKLLKFEAHTHLLKVFTVAGLKFEAHTHILKVFTVAGSALFFREWSPNKPLGSTNLLPQYQCTVAEHLRAYFAHVLQCLFVQSHTNRLPTATYLTTHSSEVSMHHHWFVLVQRIR